MQIRLVIASCAVAAAVQAATSTFTVVASFYPVYLATRNVTRDVPGVQVLSLAPPTAGCLHDYELTPADVKTLEQADVLVINGAGMEPMLEPWIKRRPELPVIDASKGIALIRQSAHHHCHHGHHHTFETATPNPHYWLSVSRYIQQVDTIALGLAAADPARAQRYLTNAALYTAALRDLRSELRQMLAGVAQRELITMHDAFPYFAQEFGFTIAGVVQREPGHAPSARHMAELAQLIKNKGLRAIFTEPQYTDAPARTLARESGVAVAELDSIVTGPDDLNAYADAMRRNAHTLAAVLAPPPPPPPSVPSPAQAAPASEQPAPHAP